MIYGSWKLHTVHDDYHFYRGGQSLVPASHFQSLGVSCCTVFIISDVMSSAPRLSKCLKAFWLQRPVACHGPTLSPGVPWKSASTAASPSRSIYIVNPEGKRTVAPILLGLFEHFERILGPNIGFFQASQSMPVIESFMHLRATSSKDDCCIQFEPFQDGHMCHSALFHDSTLVCSR